MQSVAACLDHVGHELVALLHQLHAGQRAGAAVQRVGSEVLDLGQQRPVVADQRIDAVAAHHLDAALGGLRLERIGEAHAIGAGVVHHEDRLHLELVRHEIGHVGPLEGIGRAGAEVDRLAGRPIDLGELRIGQVGVGGTRRHRGEVALAEQRRHRLAAAARHRADRGNHVGIDDHLAGVDRRLRGIVLARGRGAVVQHELPDLVAADTAAGVGFLDRKLRAVQDVRCVLGRRAGERQVDADGDEFVSGARRADQAGKRGRAKQGEGGTAGNAHRNLHGLLRPAEIQAGCTAWGPREARYWTAVMRSAMVTLSKMHTSEPCRCARGIPLRVEHL